MYGVPPVVLTTVASSIVTVTLTTSPSLSVLFCALVALVIATDETEGPVLSGGLYSAIAHTLNVASAL